MKFEPPWAGAFRLQTFVETRPDALPADVVDTIRRAILRSPFLAATQLMGGFAGTLGFSLTFRGDNLAGVAETFPAFMPFLEAALLPGCNAFILNPLVVLQGGGVAPHVDGSLRSHSPTIGCPAAVSVLYVQVPEDLQGGQLCLFRRGQEVARVTPTVGTLLRFRGDLSHQVTPMPAAEELSLETARVSLVVEQYKLAASDFALVPPFKFTSNSPAMALLS